MAYARSDFASAADFYSRLFAVDHSHPELEFRLKPSLLLAASDVLRSASRAEENGQLVETEEIYRQALLRTPAADLHGLLGGVLAKEKKWAEALAESQRQIALAGPSDDMQRRVVEALTREQFAAFMVRYFPQFAELPRTLQITSDSLDSWASPAIQVVVAPGTLDPRANHTFQPAKIVTRGEFATSLSRLTRIVGATPRGAAPIPTPHLASSGPLFQDVQLVLGYGLLSLDKAGEFGIDEPVTGEEAVNAGVQWMRFGRSFQQIPH